MENLTLEANNASNSQSTVDQCTNRQMKVNCESAQAKNTSKNASKRTYQHDNSDSNTHASGQRGYNQHASDMQADNLATTNMQADKLATTTIALSGRQKGA